VVLPVHDVNPTRRTPVVTYLLIAVNVVVFLISPVARHIVGESPAAQECKAVAFFDQYAAEPKELLHNRQDPSGATGEVGTRNGRTGCLSQSPPPFDKSPFLSVLTAMFLHGGWLHLLGNMLFLYVFGNNVEDRLGRLRYLLFYLGCGYAATYGYSLFTPGSSTPLVGASGAIAGVLGAYLVLFPRAKVWSLLTFFFFLPVRLPAWLVLGGWFLLQYLYFRGAGIADGGGVAYGAHVIGFLVGAALVWQLRNTAQHRPLQPRWGPYRYEPR
jgi:membrane associated rhomboid family serine protease